LILEEYPGVIGTKRVTAEGEQKKNEEKEKAPKIGIKNTNNIMSLKIEI
jgi:hypothetical protein